MRDLKINSKIVTPHKAIISPNFKSKTVLTNTPWDYVDLWLKRNGENNALFYWGQARAFFTASNNLPLESAPLLLYYSYMNAVKTLLEAKHISYNPFHGIIEHQLIDNRRNITLFNEGVKIKQNGILPALSQYYSETELQNTHSLKDLFLNLPYIHRTYCLTFTSQKDIFIPIKKSKFVFNPQHKKIYFQCVLSKNLSNRYTVNKLPATLELERIQNGEYIIKSTSSVSVSNSSKLRKADIDVLVDFHREIRNDIYYINGANTLWYIKTTPSQSHIINRFPTTMTLACMHRLSELCRYKPLELNKFLSSQHNWLLTEFIKQSSNQFIDEIASEITGCQFLIPNVREAT